MDGSGPGERRDTGTDGNPAAGTATVDAGDRVAAAAAELYGAGPQEFTDRRKALADSARSAGDGDAAKAIGALRKPSRAAWVVNRLVRADPSAPRRLAALADELRAAERARDGRRLRELSAARGPLIDGLTEQAFAAAGVPDPPAGLRDEVAATLTAAFADPEVGAGFAAGTLARAAHWSGFGSFAPPPDDAAAGTDLAETLARAPGLAGERAHPRDETGPAGEPAAETAAVGDPGVTRPANSERQREAGGPRRAADRRVPAASGTAAAQETGGTAALREAPRSTARKKAPRSPASDATPRSAAQAETRAAARRETARREEERLAREAAERAARRRAAYEDAERTVASASAATADAESAESRLEAEVRDLEQRLIQARNDLAAARRRARNAEAAERRARQALDRLPLPRP